jgi:hypothetical protein
MLRALLPSISSPYLTHIPSFFMHPQPTKPPMKLPSQPQLQAPTFHLMEHSPSRVMDVDVGEFSTLDDVKEGLGILVQVYNEKTKAGDEKWYTMEVLDDGRIFEVWSGGKTELQLRLYIVRRGG